MIVLHQYSKKGLEKTNEELISMRSRCSLGSLSLTVLAALGQALEELGDWAREACPASPKQDNRGFLGQHSMP